MKKYVLWSRRSPIQHAGLVIIAFALVEFLFRVLLGWDFTWSNILRDAVVITIIEIGIRSWHKYEKKNNVTTLLYKDRKKQVSGSATFKD